MLLICERTVFSVTPTVLAICRVGCPRAVHRPVCTVCSNFGHDLGLLCAVGKKNFFRLRRQTRYEPSEKQGCGEPTEKLSNYEPHNICRPNACERIAEAPGDCHCGI